MNLFSIDFTVNELQLLRQSLDVITINGKDAKFLAQLQIKLETEIKSCNDLIQAEAVKKQQELQTTVTLDSKKRQAAVS